MKAGEEGFVVTIGEMRIGQDGTGMQKVKIANGSRLDAGKMGSRLYGIAFYLKTPTPPRAAHAT